MKNYDEFHTIAIENYFDEAKREIYSTFNQDKVKQMIALGICLYKSMHRLKPETQDELDQLFRTNFLSHPGARPFTSRHHSSLISIAYREWEAQRIKNQMKV